MGTFGKAVFMCFIVFQVKGNSCPYDNELSAISIPSITTFNKSLDEPYDRIFGRRIDGLECTWTIEISGDGHIVHLNFPTFHMLNDTSTQNGDCVAIYDGDDNDIDSGHLIQELCNRMPKAGYNSTGRYLSVVFRQGDRGGWRWMTMNYTLATSPDVLEHEFWSTTFGRVLSFIIIIAIFSTFSFVFKAWRRGSISDTCSTCCDALGRCLSPVRRLGSQCADHFKSRTGGAESTSSRGERPRSRSQPRGSTGEAEDTDTDIVTISGSNRSGQGPNLSSYFSAAQGSDGSLSHGANLGEPPPDYSTVLARSASSSTSSERSDSMRQEEDAAPDYSSAVSPAFRSDSQEFTYSSVLPPPPDDGSAPPSYELPAPPSYDSLFNTSHG